MSEHVERMNKSIKLINLERTFVYSEIEDIIQMLIDEYNIIETIPTSAIGTRRRLRTG